MTNLKTFDGNITFKNCNPVIGKKYPRGTVAMILEHDDIESFLPNDSCIKGLWKTLFNDENIESIEFVIDDTPNNNEWDDFSNVPKINCIILSNKKSTYCLMVNYLKNEGNWFKIKISICSINEEKGFTSIKNEEYKIEDLSNLPSTFGFTLLNIYPTFRMQNTSCQLGMCTHFRDGVHINIMGYMGTPFKII